MENQPITEILKEFAAGDKSALDRLIPLVYSELRKLATSKLRREQRVVTLQPTALVHEAYARMLGQEQPDYRSRAHFLGVAAQVMRQILIDHARARKAAKRGGGQLNVPIKEALDAAAERPFLLIAMDEALRALERRDARKARLIEMRFFGGLTAEESAEVLELPVDEVKNDLRVAQAWLRQQLAKS
ncbi:MAG: sigma-70 family RNA polymerase sigma factor [Acidobacteriia bacterium]|nr:sigma-70 family RNA polymerase sigma factor [Terriglobia bacterium]